LDYLQLGRAGLRVSRLCLGCMSYGSSQWRPWVLDERDAQPFFKRAFDAGINFFDTADFYSTGRSEEVTGRHLKAMARREDIVIATKVGLEMGQGANSKGLSRKHIMEGIDASLKRLGTDYVDLYQIHRLDRSTPMEEIAEALDRAVKTGKVLYLGASSMWAWEFMKLLALQSAHGYARFISMQNHYNLLYREEEREMVPLCRAEGIGVIPWSPLARGLLTRPRRDQSTTRIAPDKYTPMLYGAAHEDAVLSVLERTAAKLKRPMAQVALAWLVARPGVTAPIVGATKLAQLEDAIEALSLKLEPEIIEQLELPYAPRAPAGIE
jgi:aryl-alcohol dehydrogenase-like predicted oxidoreductase